MKLFAALVCVAVVGMGIIACSSSDDDDANSTPTSEMTATAPADEDDGSVATTVDVAEADFTLAPSTTEVPMGEVTFVVSNDGPTVHEFVVIKTDLAADELPQTDNLVSEETEGIEVVDEIEDIEVGEMESLTVNLDPGHYVLICNIATHYGLGMRSDFSVVDGSS